MQEEEEEFNQPIYQDRSAQLRASLNGLAMANAGSIRLMKALKEKEEEERRRKIQEQNEKEEEQEVFED